VKDPVVDGKLILTQIFMKLVGRMYWIDVTQDRGRRQTVAIAVM
jgi:hypothetical protein